MSHTAEKDVPPCPVCGGDIRFCECMDDPFAPVPESAENGLRPDVTPEAVVALRLAADNMPLARPDQPWEGAAGWLRRRADAFEEALRIAAHRGTPPGCCGICGGSLAEVGTSRCYEAHRPIPPGVDQ